MAGRYYREVAPDRDEWRSAMPCRCMWCGTSRAFPGLEIHEIERRSHAKDRWGVRCNYLLLCSLCHGGHFSCMPHAKQLAVKFVRDRENFDLDSWLRIRDPHLKAPDRVTMNDVMREVNDVRKQMGV